MKKISTAAMIILILPWLSGCVAVAAGAAAGGATGYYISKEEDRPSPQVDEDAGITARVRERFVQDPEISALKINVDTYDDIVTLSGDIPNDILAERAIAMARSTEKVKGVRSELTIH